MPVAIVPTIKPKFETIELSFVDADTKPLVAARVGVSALSADGKTTVKLFSGRTNAEGKVLVKIPVLTADQSVPPLLLRVSVLDLDGDPLHSEDIEIVPEKRISPIKVQAIPQTDKAQPSIGDGTAILGRRLAPDLAKLLEQNNVKSLSDLRREKTRLAEGLSDSDPKKDFDELMIHAQLQLFSRNFEINGKLLAAGIHNISDVVNQPQSLFLKEVMAQGVSTDVASKLYLTARRQMQVLDNIAIEQKVNRANGIANGSNGTVRARSAANAETYEGQACECDCDSAVSPQAYLVDLLDFAVENVLFEGGHLEVPQLEDLLGQPFGALPTDCGFADQLVRQVRLMIEALSKSNALGPFDLPRIGAILQAHRAHASRAYDALLRGLGTSQRELRQIRADSDAAEKLAERLGIAPEHLDRFRIKPEIFALVDVNAPLDRIEALFGLVSTGGYQANGRDPLSTGAKFNDERHQITRLLLRGVQWRKNTDELGRIYISIVKRPAGNYEVILFRQERRSRSDRLAMGSLQVAKGVVDLVPENRSGLTGRVEFDFTQDDVDISLVVIPEWLVRRKQYLRMLWQKDDTSASPFEEPIIDPDVVAESDLMMPLKVDNVEKNPAHALWKSRRDELDEKRQTLKDLGSIGAMLTDLFGEPVDKGKWHAIAADLQSSEPQKVDQAREELKKLDKHLKLDEHLKPQLFSFFNVLLSREDSNDEIKVEEREQALDVLVFFYKVRKFADWKTEETRNGIQLSPPFFYLSDRQPALKPLRVVDGARDRWLAELERSCTPPLLDPDIVSRGNFAHESASDLAYTKWVSRRDLVGDGRPAGEGVEGSLFKAIAGIDSAEKLESALTTGDLPGGQGGPIFHSIGLTGDQLASIAVALKEGNDFPITPEQYGLTPEELRMLMEVRQLAASPAEDVRAEVSDWEQVHHILVQAEKRRYLHPQWHREEQTEGIFLTPDAFSLHSDALTEYLPVLERTPGFLQWRFDLGRQRDWRARLEARLEQERAVEAELQAAVESAEEASLPILRDDLIKAIKGIGAGAGDALDAAKRSVMNDLLINTFDNGCRKTTRVAQAIETVQLLIWGIYNGQFESEKFTLEPTSLETFTVKWRWMGSYATWRSAMFTYLYPENLLLPEFRRKILGNPNIATDPTTLFRAILKVTSGQGTNESESDSSQPVVDGDLTPYIEAINKWPGGNKVITTLNDQKALYWHLRFLRLPAPLNIGHDYEAYSSFSVMDGSNELILRPNKPADSETNPYYIAFPFNGIGTQVEGKRIRLDDVWMRYRTPSAFLEDVLYIPLSFALNQLSIGHFEDALYWFGLVYNYQESPAPNAQGWADPRLELHFRQREGADQSYYTRVDDWLKDDLNPHRIADTRKGMDVRFVLLCIIRCLLEYADSEFAKDNTESLARARELYESARRLLDSPLLGKKSDDCNLLLLDIARAIADKDEQTTVLIEAGLYLRMSVASELLSKSARHSLVIQILDLIKPVDPPKPAVQIRRELGMLFGEYFVPAPPQTAEMRRSRARDTIQDIYERLLANESVFGTVQQVSVNASIVSPHSIMARSQSGSTTTTQESGNSLHNVGLYSFCIPRNPLIGMLRLRYEVSWFKLNDGMNLAGQRREVPVYAAPTDTYSGLPVAESGSATGFSAAARFVPTQYRYRVLIERARQLISLAQQMEATYLSFLEKRDQEAYTLLRAQQDLGIARANVTLQELRVTEAEDGKKLANEQWNKVNAAFEHYHELLSKDLLASESIALDALRYALLAQAAAVAAGAIAGGLAIGAASGGAGAGAGAALGALVVGTLTNGAEILQSISALNAMQASLERREQEWKFQKELASIDMDIADAQKNLALDYYNIVLQEKLISEMGAENASDVINFLSTKFTTAELYAWMGGIVGSIYRYMLQEATTTAKLAQRQLAFERQQAELSVVQDDYWTYTDPSAILRGDGATDRLGMTGSARLLQDTTRLDQEAFLTDQRKLQLSKTFSLALLDPLQFAEFRESGELLFSTTLEHFDRDFPGHYLRLIKRVRVSVIALVPPTEGIHATLFKSGISRAVRGGDRFTEVEIVRDPETIAFTSPINATGVFELVEQPDMLLPFEGSGVATSWIFSMPRAANVVDYSTIADILVTIEYTALDSPIFRQQVIQKLDRSISNERPFSLRFQFADAWYDLNNSDMLEAYQQMRVTFETRRSDFPPNVTDLEISHVSLYFVRKEGFTEMIKVDHLLFTEAGRAGTVGGGANTNTGRISTRDPNAGSWLAMQGRQPIGKWELKFPDTDVTRKWFKDGMIDDILFVITYDGTTSAWTR